MEKLQVFQTVHPSIRKRPDVSLFPQVILPEIETTQGTLALLSFEQHCDAGRDFRMCAASGCPIQPVTIEGTSYPTDFDMPTNRRVAALVQAQWFCRKAPRSVLKAPILASAPAFSFVGMASARPRPQFVEQPGVYRMQHSFAAYRGVVIRPSFDAWVEVGDQTRLGGLRLLIDGGGEHLLVTADVRFAWLDDGLETERLAASIVSGACLANPILAYLEAQKVKSDRVVVFV